MTRPIRSSYCGEGGCVHVQLVGEQVLVMADPTARQALAFTLDEWDVFTAGVRNGEFDVETLRRQEAIT